MKNNESKLNRLLKQNNMKAELVKREDRWDLYVYDGSKIASTAPNPMHKLSVKNCQAIENGYDLDELYEELVNSDFSDKYEDNVHYYSFLEGFKKAIELMGDKKFSETELYHAFLINSAGNNTTLRNFFEQTVLPMFQQNEFDVEIITEPMNLDEIKEQGKGFLHSNTNKPKLDENGCLILKRI